MSLTIRCDFVDADWRSCTEELSGFGFDAKPATWAVVVTDPDLGMHSDYCPEHAFMATRRAAAEGAVLYPAAGVR
jgi:hypothetical protein